jgi:hypothetical protein
MKRKLYLRCHLPTIGVTIMSILRRTLGTACVVFLLALSGCSSGSRPADADWLTYNRTPVGDRFIGVASGMKSPMWPGGAQPSRILVDGVR